MNTHNTLTLTERTYTPRGHTHKNSVLCVVSIVRFSRSQRFVGTHLMYRRSYSRRRRSHNHYGSTTAWKGRLRNTGLSFQLCFITSGVLERSKWSLVGLTSHHSLANLAVLYIHLLVVFIVFTLFFPFFFVNFVHSIPQANEHVVRQTRQAAWTVLNGRSLQRSYV